MFERGQHILYRGIHVTDSGAEPPVVADVKPAVISEDRPGCVELWIPAGTPTRVSRPLDPAQPKPWFSGQWRLDHANWRWHALFHIDPEAWHATWLRWTPEGEFLGWYINIQEPLVRTPLGFDHRDLQLDIVVAPDRTWRWKDHDDLSRSVETGVISGDNARTAREAGERALILLEARDHPFDDAAPGRFEERPRAIPLLPEIDYLAT